MTRKKVRRYMQNVIEGHRDSLTGEVNCTTLAEDAAMEFERMEEWLEDETHFVWDIAIEVAEADAKSPPYR